MANSTKTAGGPKPDAILFLPGLGEQGLPQGAMDIAQRIARSIDLDTDTASARVTARASRPLAYGCVVERQADVAEIVRAGGEESERVVADVIRVRYHNSLFHGLDERGPLAQLAFICWHGALLTWRWGLGLFRNWCVHRAPSGFGLRKRLQLLLGGGLVFVVWLGAVLVLIGGVSVPPLVASSVLLDEKPASATDTAPEDGRPQENDTGSTPEGNGSADVSAAQSVLERVRETAYGTVYPLIAALAGLLMLTKGNLKEGIRTGALQLAATHDYLAADGHKRGEVVAEVEDALEAIVESDRYERITIVGYSLGAIVALDATHLNPRPPPRIKRRISTLVTVACPYDVVATYWPEYFDRDEPSQLAGLPWHNVYSPKDVLGSDFRLLGDRLIQPTTNVAYPAVRSAMADTILLGGLFAHSRYWAPEAPDHPAVWRIVVHSLYPAEHWVMR